ncbi:hypothetical protein HHK36_003652 [Tetracentron sinense]|uniref:Uncharacterized protein n=1 Tax=Tetracentron sinense TaxID=13715 RepID=A0A834ZTS9_TETSI|nr:hypothetical protein HHK36_003652 [Tetracentron sinense]
MALVNGEGSNEMVQAQAHIWNHIFNFINSMSLKCAIQLGVPDAIHNHGQPITLSELVAALSIPPAKTQAVYRLMRMLVHSGFFAIHEVLHQDQEGYVLTPSSRLLLKGKPTSVSPFLLAMLDPILLTPWNFLSAWFMGSELCPFETAHGGTIWDYAGKDSVLNNFLNEAMASDARLAMSVVVRECKEIFEGLTSLVDVGGGTGTAAKILVETFPHLKCTVFDLPHVVSTLQVSNNLDYIGGDMFNSIPPADAILLKWILHDWSDDECLKILKQCKEAILSKDKGGKVIIIDMVVEDKKGKHESIETQLFFDMMMMTLATGRERNEKEWKKLFLEAGFSHYKITPVLGLRSLIEVYP